MLPRVTVTVENVIGSSPLAQGFLMTRNATAPAASASTMIRGSQRLTCTLGKVIPRYEPEVARLLRIVATRRLSQRHFKAGGCPQPRPRHQRHVAPVRASDPAREREAQPDPT